MTFDRAPRSRRLRANLPISAGHKICTRELTEKVSAALLAFPAKVIADATGGSWRSAENARQGVHAMSLAHFINAAREIPELRALALELLGCEGETDPEFHRALHHLVNAYVRKGQAHETN